MNDPSPQPRDVSWAESIDAIRTLIQAQDLRAAKQQLRRLQNTADDATWAMVVEVANTLRFKTQPVALTKLRKLWRDNEAFRPLIEACVPKTGENQYIPPPARASSGMALDTASNQATKVTQRVDPDKRIQPGRRVKTPNTKIIDDYERSLAADERDDPGTPRPEPITDRHDYDLDALTHVATTLCVSCRLERAAIDRHTDRVQAGLGDDGLCGECRSLGRSGLPELTPGHSLTDQTHTRLEFLAEHFPTQGRGIFRQEWRYADPNARPIISAWVKEHTNADPARDPTPRASKSTDLNGWCESCGEFRQLVPTQARSNRGKELCFDCEPRYRAGITIEARHAMYAAGDGSTRAQVEERRAPGEAVGPTPSKAADNQQHSPRTAVPEPSTNQSNVGAPVGAHRKRLVESAREKARAAAQERRRAMNRNPTVPAPNRSIRH